MRSDTGPLGLGTWLSIDRHGASAAAQWCSRTGTIFPEIVQAITSPQAQRTRDDQRPLVLGYWENDTILGAALVSDRTYVDCHSRAGSRELARLLSDSGVQYSSLLSRRGHGHDWSLDARASSLAPVRSLVLRDRDRLERAAPGDGFRAASHDDMPLLFPMFAGGVQEQRLDLALDYAHLWSQFVDYTDRGAMYFSSDGGEPLFMACVPCVTPEAVVVECVFTRPDRRREGIAMRGMSVLCSRLLHGSRTVVVRVEAGNTPALRLYARLGFRRGPDLDVLTILTANELAAS
jgi:GNAT superfamily N-acetyltransferase